MDIKLYNDDCFNVFPVLEENSIDLTVTSPPYDNLRTYYNSLVWNEDVWKDVIKELYRVTKDGGVVVWVVSDATIEGSETGTSFKQALYGIECGFRLHDTMIWEKPGFSAVGTLKTRYASVFEYMFILVKGKLKTFNPIKDKLNVSAGRCITGTNVDRNGISRKVSMYGNVVPEYGQRYNIWKTSPEMNRSIKHPAPFPIKLIEDHVISWSNANDLVLDPFMGSGTTGVACKNLNRSFIGIEKEENYFNIAKERINGTYNDTRK